MSDTPGTLLPKKTKTCRESRRPYWAMNQIFYPSFNMTFSNRMANDDS